MTDRICSKAQINKIAVQLNEGHHDAAMRQVGVCTVGLGNHSDYAKDMHKNFASVMHGDVAATQKAEGSFAKLANDERHLWQSISTAAHDKNPHGLCQLTIVENKEQGPHAEITGAKCH